MSDPLHQGRADKHLQASPPGRFISSSSRTWRGPEIPSLWRRAVAGERFGRRGGATARWRHQRIIECPEKEMAAPDDLRARNMRKAVMHGVDKGVTGVVEGLRDDPPGDFVSLGRHDGAQPRETRPSAGEIAAGRKCR